MPATSFTLSIKARASIAFGLLLVAIVTTLGALQMRELRAGFARVVADQQRSVVQRTARDIDTNFASGVASLVATAATLADADPDQHREVRQRLGQHAALMTFFDDLLVIDAAGRITADLPELAGRVGVNASDRAFFRDAVATASPAISEPLVSKVRKEPIVQIGVPMFREGRLRGVLVGVIRLQRPTLLGELSTDRLGQQGYFLMLTRGTTPVYVANPDRTRLLKPRPADGADFVTRATQGFEGTGESRSSFGVDTLYSSALLKQVPWVLVAAAPKSEIFAPLQAAERRVLGITIAAALAAMLLAWIATGWLLAPLKRLRDAMLAMREGTQAREALVERDDEVGELTRTFNGLMRERGKALESMRRSEAELVLLADHLPALVSYLDLDLRVRFANACYQDWFGIDPASMIGRRPDEIFGEQSWTEVEPHLRAALEGYPVTFVREIRTLGGARWTRTVVRPCMDDGGRVTGVYRMSSDISADRRAQHELATLVSRDALTGLGNRRAMQEGLALAFARARRDDRWLAVACIDLDRFKAVNDTLGHAAGDEVLVEVARRLRGCVRATDLVARPGGDEFMLVLEGLGAPQDAVLVGEKVVAELSRAIATRAGECGVGASIGIAACFGGVIAAEELLRHADAAAYEAKRAGGGRCVMGRVEAPALKLARG